MLENPVEVATTASNVVVKLDKNVALAAAAGVVGGAAVLGAKLGYEKFKAHRAAKAVEKAVVTGFDK
jgi:hypothetical protein